VQIAMLKHISMLKFIFNQRRMLMICKNCHNDVDPNDMVYGLCLVCEGQEDHSYFSPVKDLHKFAGKSKKQREILLQIKGSDVKSNFFPSVKGEEIKVKNREFRTIIGLQFEKPWNCENDEYDTWVCYLTNDIRIEIECWPHIDPYEPFEIDIRPEEIGFMARVFLKDPTTNNINYFGDEYPVAEEFHQESKHAVSNALNSASFFFEYYHKGN
jgi:hypothetical protein